MATRWLAAITAALIAPTALGATGRAACFSGAPDLYIRYFETTQATYAEIVISDGRLRARYFDDTAGKCERWVEQRPCWTGEESRIGHNYCGYFDLSSKK